MQAQKSLWVRIGDFFFKYRNWFFPAVMVFVFITYMPPYEYYHQEWLEEVKDMIASAIVFSGLTVRAAVIGYAYIKRGGLGKRVYAKNLVTEGFFAVCRNPLYVGNMLIYSGVFLMHGNPYIFILGTLAMYGIYSSIIAAEEHFLRQEFGEAYQTYCQNVPRWLPKFSHIKAATQGMAFNWRRVVVKDYTTITNTGIVLAGLELLEHWHEAPFVLTQAPALIVGIIVALLAMMAAISIAKKRKWLQVS